ncbi:uncharacterized protein LOC106161315 isoform X1 [Lingula anatina]|uniref:Uncharacterized protein LOC106161315 isoform X1 n=1 Tax=Lingula anatina TaxID=7574 RepID=A0A1S3I752_LINAN|nr:uncharacterized protein LOC106161315 isoform X1 [Lingula anatina]|eukprot:XP_013393681.1 uncharacterized protein LOC106161315 isoform X1 [Lingula anatina]
METFEKTLPLITKNVKMGSVDIRHAYYSIKLADEQQKFFRFQWRDKIYQYTCLPNGVSEGPRLFTKLLKPVFGKLRSLGYVSSGYIDDSLIIGCDDLECTENLNATVTLLSKLGFIINEDKSVLRPTSKLKFLGNVIDSDKMIVTLPLDRQEKIISACEELYNVSKAPIRQVARVIGLLVASFSAVDYGKLYYRKLERAKIKALQESKGNYDAPMIISNSMRSDLIWWIVNLKSQHRVIARPNPSETLHTDASTLGWGASYKNNNIGGRWTDVEGKLPINVLELMAILNALKSLKRDLKSKHIKVMSDNTTAVSYINNMGGTVSENCNKVACDIWIWCISHDVWLTCTHIAGKNNEAADKASREFKDDLEWKLDSKIFHKICNFWGIPDIDCFASRINAQVETYCSWKPDPNCSFVDAFTIDWETFNSVYLFPPFSLLGNCVQKVRQDRAKGIIVAPMWPTQAWFPRLMELLVEKPVIIQKKKNLLRLPHLQLKHPLEGKLRLIACKVSGIVSENEDFQRTLPKYLCCLGKQGHKNNITHTLTGGFSTVVKGRLLHFRQLWKQ